MFYELLKYFGLALISAGSLSWVTKRLIQHFLDKDIERFKNELRLSNEFEIERLKSDLQTASSLRQIQFSSLHAKQAELIHEVFKKLVELETAAEILETWVQTGRIEDVKEPADKHLDVYFDFHNFVRMHQIFFSAELAAVLADLHSDIFNTSIDAHYHLDENNFEDFKSRFKAEYPAMQAKAKRARSTIMSEFRGLLGVSAVTG